ncbi:D-hexose-6-phosphate mutarotase [Phytobacter diazotrophicus]|jgi:glucose-6-phosphate 1-epimerase|uniref:Putative glucose-6-phosphate 1-epimerase n=1 Tax=Phytobacter diazotrophicus TaxID=395631 RepID=A0ABN6LN52_9ENTR|nr:MULTISPECIES: D-hexose-6-phosphate mutarotase [Phytobacter]MDU4153350.1 D-hexose-6-phosphate mutarotase [Enterobacteriaceae bacterium]PTA96772.1 D-hexose-6-phosphate mutarotase [Kluyvera sp. Nf5]PXW56644.1 glucose-6-phosphate 1-epimerase [Grimontella sp. AG753]QIH63044.1 D-hexose-6-phosphate mutarotase [Enterobacteriaceae bacterium A-F18]SLJ91802.1 glucose-6-phosphate 1-epimerase [Enterobacter sp. NFR05]
MINKIFALPVVEQISSALSRRLMDELDVIVIDHPQVKASFALQGAHLLSWKPQGEDEALWLSGNTPFKNGVALRGGVPICWPWFGPAAQQGLPAHGFARNLAWTLKAHNEDDKGVVLTFELHSSEASRQYWPHDFTLFARYKLGKTCEIELEAHGDFETTSALHTYFNVGDIHAVKVSGLGDRFIDKVNNAQEDALTDGVQTFPDRTDRVYLNPEACSVIHDSALNRTIEVIHHHHTNVVAWNPGPALSASMTDMPDDGYKTFVCVESACATAPQKTTEEKPSRLAQTIRVVKR